jgi:hypothetical protein
MALFDEHRVGLGSSSCIRADALRLVKESSATNDERVSVMLAQCRRMALCMLIIAIAVSGCGRSLSADSTASRVARSQSTLSAGDDEADARVSSRSNGASSNQGDNRRRPGSRSGGQGGGAPGAPFGSSGGTAIGAPVNIPAFTIEGALFYEQRQFVTDEIIKACGDGTQCVGIATSVQDATTDGDPDNDGFEPCAVLAETPAQTVKRSSSITFRIAAPCGEDGSPSDAGSETSQQTGQDNASEGDEQPDSTTGSNSDDDATNSNSDDGIPSQEQAAPSTDGIESPEQPVNASEG